MRFDTSVTFYRSAPARYNPRTHKYDGEDSIVKQSWANVTAWGLERSMRVFGEYKVNRKVVRIADDCPSDWDYLKIEGGSSFYRLDTQLNVLKGTAIIVREDKTVKESASNGI